jgi:hypothetical protein
VNFHGERRSNETHASTTDPDSRLAKKTRGSEAKLAYLGEALMDNRHGLVVGACVMHATGTAEREAATGLLAGVTSDGATVGADKLYDTHDWVETTRQFGIAVCRAEAAQGSAHDAARRLHRESHGAGRGARWMAGRSQGVLVANMMVAIRVLHDAADARPVAPV